MKLVLISSSIAALIVAATAMAEPAKTTPPAKDWLGEESIPTVRPQVRQLSRIVPTDKPLPPSAGLGDGCRSSARAALEAGEGPGLETPPPGGDTEVAMNRILLVDLGERELKKRNELKSQKSADSPGTTAPECPEGLQAKP